MKTSTNLLQAERCQNEATPKKAIAGKVLRYLLFIFMFLQIFVLYSCEVAYRTPRHHRNEIIIGDNDRNNNRHDRGERNGQRNHNDYDEHR
jgi:hypothetical protein